MKMSGHLNAYRPDPDLEYEDPRLREAAQHAHTAERMDAQRSERRAQLWEQCLRITLEVAAAAADTADHETTFALELAMRAAIECEQYDEAAGIAVRLLGRA